MIIWTIQIDDGFINYKYVIPGRGDVSINDIAEIIEKALDGKIISSQIME